MSSVASPEEICNIALDRIGYPQSIGDMFEGTKVARVGMRLYSQTRDDVMRAKDWPFAKRFVVASYFPSLAPPPPWLYEYIWPGDCLRLRYVMPTLATSSYPNNNPQAVLFEDINEQRVSPAVKAIVTNQVAATLVYTGQVVDMTTWDANFVDALVEALARRFVIALGRSPDQLVPEVQLTEQAIDAALGAQANQPPDTAWQKGASGKR